MSAAEEPLVSVLTASYNSDSFIEETLESALGQSYERLEVVVADDRSTDSTPEVVEAVADRHPGKVKLLRYDENLGPCRRRNDALAAAGGSLICWLDGDDLWLPGKVEKQVELMRSRPEVGLVHTGFEAFDSDTGEPVAGGAASARDGDLLVPLFAEWNFIGSLTAMFRREALDRVGGRLRDIEFAYGDDYYLWLAIALDWRIAGIDGVFARYRITGSNLSFRQGNHYLMEIALLEDFLREFPQASERLGRRRRIGIGRRWLRAAGFELERRNLAAGMRYWLRGAIRAPLAAIGRPFAWLAGKARGG